MTTVPEFTAEDAEDAARPRPQPKGALGPRSQEKAETLRPIFRHDACGSTNHGGHDGAFPDAAR